LGVNAAGIEFGQCYDQNFVTKQRLTPGDVDEPEPHETWPGIVKAANDVDADGQHRLSIDKSARYQRGEA
jgi:hypothetical protein